MVTSFLQDNQDINYSGWKVHSGTHSAFLPVIMSFSNTKIFFVLPVAVLANALKHSHGQHTLKRKHRFEKFETLHFSSLFPLIACCLHFTRSISQKNSMRKTPIHLSLSSRLNQTKHLHFCGCGSIQSILIYCCEWKGWQETYFQSVVFAVLFLMWINL